MKINKIKLENIRSYLNQEIEFPDGSVLLSGNVGSGKSSVLLAIDFAFFGLRKGTGSSLLRNGEREGSVELNFEIDGKEIVIKRILKREGELIKQDNGYIIVNGEKEEKSAIELKQRVLELLNYPKELLTKSKSLIYRYSVYTPQEEMKLILLGDKEIRLDTLRKVFGIDKYKRINENISIVSGRLRERNREIAGKIFDLEDRKKEIEEKREEINELRNEIGKLKPDLDAAEKELKSKKNEIKEVSENIEKANELNKNIELAEAEINNKVLQTKKNKERILELDDEIDELRKELRGKKEEDVEGIEHSESEIKRLEKRAKESIQKAHEFKIKKEQSLELIEKISSMDKCPVCMQKVSDEHVEHIKEAENKKIIECKREMDEVAKEEKRVAEELEAMKKNLEILKKRQSEAELIKFKRKGLEYREDESRKLNKELLILKREIGNINLKKNELILKAERFKDIKIIYERRNKELETVQEKFREIELKKTRFESEEESLKKIILNLDEDIKKKDKLKEQLGYFVNLGRWLNEYFVNLMSNMERKIMLKIHSEFNNLFEKWFSIIIDSDVLKMNLDEEFSPRIEQNGHEIDYEYLSGGEKTAAALAYRLSLNQIINSLMSVIRTRDLLILDEPTDGFSSEQLDRVKLVLDELNIKQVIIVSHEAKIESFVDSVIRFEKEGHVSRVV